MPIPKVIIVKKSRLSLIKLSEFIEKNDDEIKSNLYRSIFIDDILFLKNNFDLFQRILKLGYFDLFYAKDFDCLKYIEQNLKDYKNITLSLVDDFENLDRSYLDLSFFQKTSIEIPFSYVLWNPLLQENQKISLYNDKTTLNPYSTNLYENVSTYHLEKIKELIYQLSEKYCMFSDIEKTMLISNYIQNHVQYIASNNVSESIYGTYVTDSKGLKVTSKLVGNPETVLLQNFGLCNGIANATTMLLNNPQMNVNMRSVEGMGHVWNIVCFDGKYYYVDNTWNITRNPNKFKESLKAESFTSDYLFFGENTANAIGNHIPNSYCPLVEQQDMNVETINELQRKLTKVTNFSNYNKPVFDSYLQK